LEVDGTARCPETPAKTLHYVPSLNACCDEDKVKEEAGEWVVKDDDFYQPSANRTSESAGSSAGRRIITLSDYYRALGGARSNRFGGEIIYIIL
jgi:hypothetical protein